MQLKSIARGDNIKHFIKRDELKGLKTFSISMIPQSILNFTGEVKEISFPDQGMCSLVMVLDCVEKRYILKIAKGIYRGMELHAEFCCMKELKESPIPVPDVHIFYQEDDLFYLLRDYTEGKQLSTLFNGIENEDKRLRMIDEMAGLLADIHGIEIKDYEYGSFIDHQLFFAEKHLGNNTIDLEEFVFEGQYIEPTELLEWLKQNRPSTGKLSLIHGDFRPKNMLWHNNKIESIFDWSFCDIGDPYYDIALFMYYMRNDQERERFRKAYGLKMYDKDRIKYFNYMVSFINI